MIKKIPYGGVYPSTLKRLMEEGLIGPPRQKERATQSTTGVDIIYILKGEGEYGWGIETLEENLERILLAVYQDLKRYETKYPEVLFWGSVTYYRGGKKVEAGVHTASLDIFIWGPDYEVAQYDLRKHLEAIIELKKKYPKERFVIRKILARPHERILE